MGHLVSTRRGTQRADNVHPLQWWVLSESGRRDAAASWKIKHGEILSAKNRRSIPRVSLEDMPPSTNNTTPSATLAMASNFLVTTDFSSDPVSTGIITEAALTTTKAVDVVSLYEDHDWTMPTTRGNCAAVSKVEPPAWGNCAAVSKAEPPEGGPPQLVDESDDEDWRGR